jgi:pyruvate dehydrogenase E1 component beta subunit
VSITYREALGRALRDAMTADERVLLLGQDIGARGGAYGVTAGLLEDFGPQRVRDAPSAEAALVGFGVGAALAGLRPVVELPTAAFLPLAFDQVLHQLAAAGPMSGGALRAPLVLRVPQGTGARLGPVHTANVEGLLHHIPGLRVLAPATAADAYGMLRWAATETSEPAVVLEHVQLYDSVAGEHVGVVDDVARAAVRRAGGDVTLIAASRMVAAALQAAATLSEQHGFEATVVDLRTLRPLDVETIATAVRGANGRAVIAEEGWPHGGVGATLAAELRGRVVRVSGADAHVPYAAALEAAALPDAAAIVRAALPLARVRDRRSLGAPDHTMSIEVSLAALERGSIAEQVAARCADLLSGYGECAIAAPEEPLVLLGENRRASARRPAVTLTFGPVIARPSARDGAVTVLRSATLTLALAAGLASAAEATELLAALRERLATAAE